MNRQRLAVLVGGGFLLLVIVLTLLYRRPGPATIVMESVPSDLHLTLDGKTINANGATGLEPGTHTLRAERQDFIAGEQTFTIARDETKNFGMYLEPANEAGEQWLDDHPTEVGNAEGGTGRQFDEVSESIAERYPIMDVLPIIDDEFRIDYGPSKNPGPDGAIALYIQTSDKNGRELALGTLEIMGFNPDDYEIIYVKPR